MAAPTTQRIAGLQADLERLIVGYGRLHARHTALLREHRSLLDRLQGMASRYAEQQGCHAAASATPWLSQLPELQALLLDLRLALSKLEQGSTADEQSQDQRVLQNATATMAEFLQMVTNMLKSMHDMEMAPIRNVRG